MVKLTTHSHILLLIMSGQFTLEDAESMSSAISAASAKEEELYLIALPINMTGFPHKVSEMIKASSAMHSLQGQVRRIYGLKYNTVMSFIANVSTQVLRLKSNTLEASNLEELYQIIEKETELFPALKSSWQAHGGEIKEAIAQFEAELA